MIGHGGSDVVVDGAKNRVLHVRVMTADGDIMSHSKESRTNTHTVKILRGRRVTTLTFVHKISK